MDIKKCNIMLIGFMGTGKTTVSESLSKMMNIAKIDMDEEIENHTKMKISDIFAKYGEEYFRKVETESLVRINNSVGKIVSCGGGAVLKDENVSIMKENGVIVLLKATPETVYNRVKDCKDRPILNGNMNIKFIEELMNKRKDRYFDVADIVIETDYKDVTEISKEIMSKLREFDKK